MLRLNKDSISAPEVIYCGIRWENKQEWWVEGSVTQCSGANTSESRSPWRLRFVEWRLIFVGPPYENSFIQITWRLEF